MLANLILQDSEKARKHTAGSNKILPVQVFERENDDPILDEEEAS